jgi:hypothetical protein
VDAESRIQPIVDNAGDYSYWGSGTPAYEAISLHGRPTPEQLRTAGPGFVPARQYYVRLPELSPEVLTLTDSLLAGLPTTYDKAITLERWFREEFSYTLDLPRTPREATLEHFLLQRREGHCEYFSTAMAILLRTHGIPTREVNGFLGGEWSEFGNYLAVTQNQAHAWVEVWFPGLGWVPFDPTPAGSGGSEALSTWLWPGRFLFDAVQHRWNKWVLDYSLQTQFGLLRRGEELLRRNTDSPDAQDDGGATPLPGGLLWWVGGAALLLGAGLLSRRRSVAYPTETRLFLRLRELSRRAGVPEPALHSPLSLASYLDEAGHPGASSARAVVEGYLRARFSGTPLEPAHRTALANAFGRARGFLRKEPVR